jgi:hypothetical protein
MATDATEFAVDAVKKLRKQISSSDSGDHILHIFGDWLSESLTYNDANIYLLIAELKRR